MIDKERCDTMQTQDFVPIVIGSNKGAYSLCRAIHEYYRIKPESIIVHDLQGTKYSQIITKHFYPHLLTDFPQTMQEVITHFSAAYPDLPKIIFGSDDWFVEQLVTYRDLFPNDWTVPYVSQAIHDQAIDKSNFYEICQTHHIPYPQTFSESELDQLPDHLSYVVKAANTPLYQNLSFKGKEKVYLCPNKSHAQAAVKLIREAGYHDSIVIQEQLALKPTYQASITAYRSPHDLEIKLISFGKVMVEDPTPESLGNNLVILTQEIDPKVYDDSKRLLEALEWTGFANFDLIYNERTGEYNFLEINPRLPMTNYYATAAGGNVAKYYIEDYLLKKPMDLTILRENVVFTSLTKHLTQKVIGQTPDWQTVASCYQKGQVYNAFSYHKEWDPRRHLYVLLNKLNYYRKFKRVNFI